MSIEKTKLASWALGKLNKLGEKHIKLSTPGAVAVTEDTIFSMLDSLEGQQSALCDLLEEFNLADHSDIVRAVDGKYSKDIKKNEETI